MGRPNYLKNIYTYNSITYVALSHNPIVGHSLKSEYFAACYRPAQADTG